MRSSSRSATGDFGPEDFPDGFPGACPALARDFPAPLAGLPLPFRFVSLSALATAHPFPSGPSIVRRTGHRRYRCQGPVTAKVVPGV